MLSGWNTDILGFASIKKRKKGNAGVHFIISWLLRKSDIPHEKYGLWLNGFECSKLP
jgi:hypothetical protein